MQTALNSIQRRTRPGWQVGAVDSGVGPHSAGDASPAGIPLRAEEGGAQHAQQAQRRRAATARAGAGAGQARQQVGEQRAVFLVIEVVIQHKGDVLRAGRVGWMGAGRAGAELGLGGQGSPAPVPNTRAPPQRP